MQAQNSYRERGGRGAPRGNGRSDREEHRNHGDQGLQDSDRGGRGGNYRGRGGNFRGQGGNFRGQGGNFRGQDGNFRGQDGNFRGEGENFRGQGGNFRGQGRNFRGRGGNDDGGSGRERRDGEAGNRGGRGRFGERGNYRGRGGNAGGNRNDGLHDNLDHGERGGADGGSFRRQGGFTGGRDQEPRDDIARRREELKNDGNFEKTQGGNFDGSFQKEDVRGHPKTDSKQEIVVPRGEAYRGGARNRESRDSHQRMQENVGSSSKSKSGASNDENRGNMSQQQRPRLALNIFGLELGNRTIFRHVVQMKLLDEKNKKDYILTTMSARGRGNRASKQKDNFILLEKLLDKWVEKKSDKKHPVFAYDGAQSLFALEGISVHLIIPNEDAIKIPQISEFLKDSINFLNGDLEISCEPDLEKPSFVQTELNEWSDPRFYAYLDIVTSQSAIRSGKYLSQSRGLYVNTQHMETLRVGWAVAAKGIHKGCRIVGTQGPLPILELDPQSTQYYAPIPLSEMLKLAFPRDFAPNRVTMPNNRLGRAVKLLMKELKCNPYYDDLGTWATNTMSVSDIDFNAPNDPQYREKYRNLKYPMMPAAVCGMGQRKRLMPLEHLKVLPYQSIDRRVLEEFELTPRANSPEERWNTLQSHYDEFGFNDEVMKNFGVLLCNDPFTNISEIDAERVAKPSIAYADPVHVDDEKRDWKAQDKKFVSPSTVDFLMVVLVAGYTRNFDAEKQAVEYVANAFCQRCQDKGMRIGQTDFACFEGERDSESFLTGVFKRLVTHPDYNKSTFTPFVLFVSDDVPNIHECLKFEERMSDIPTQHILLKNARKIRDNMMKKSQNGRRAYDLTLDNIVMKANIKCGGLNYTADIPQDIASWKQVSTFVMGMDVAHPDRTATREGNPSTVGLSCNSAENPYSFIGDFQYTDPKREAIQDEILRRFTDQNVRSFAELRGFPKKVIIFRDGVSFGEESEALREVEIIEQTIINAAREEGHRDYRPKVLAVVVKKRHHTRFYLKGGYQGNQPTNPLPDTSVGGEIAEYGKRQIFIQAFRPVQGTAKVPSFLVIRDDDEVTDDHISKLVCAVCSLHQLVNSPTSIPTPVYVAHELAKRGTGLFKAYRFKHGDLHDDWETLTSQLSYSTLDRLSKVRVV